jgi:hypothetical protein
MMVSFAAGPRYHALQAIWNIIIETDLMNAWLGDSAMNT